MILYLPLNNTLLKNEKKQIISLFNNILFFDFADSWFQVAFILTSGVNSAYVLGYSGSIMVPLGWIGGVVGLVLATAISLYANALIAKLHEFGGTRHIRYRDLAGYIYGKPNRRNTKWESSSLFPLFAFHVILLCKLLMLISFSLQVGKHILSHGFCSISIFS